MGLIVPRHRSSKSSRVARDTKHASPKTNAKASSSSAQTQSSPPVVRESIAVLVPLRPNPNNPITSIYAVMRSK
jgi:hypothetical protein